MQNDQFAAAMFFLINIAAVSISILQLVSLELLRRSAAVMMVIAAAGAAV